MLVAYSTLKWRTTLPLSNEASVVLSHFSGRLVTCFFDFDLTRFWVIHDYCESTYSYSSTPSINRVMSSCCTWCCAGSSHRYRVRRCFTRLWSSINHRRGTYGKGHDNRSGYRLDSEPCRFCTIFSITISSKPLSYFGDIIPLTLYTQQLISLFRLTTG